MQEPKKNIFGDRRVKGEMSSNEAKMQAAAKKLFVAPRRKSRKTSRCCRSTVHNNAIDHRECKMQNLALTISDLEG
jgi:hypothetical protein